MDKSKPGLFAREATGLVREIGFTLGVIIILSHVVGLGWQKRAFQFTGAAPMPTDMMPLGLPAMFWAFLVCGIIVLVTGYAAGYVAAAMPRSGGGYVTISRVIHPVVGYMGGWLMFLAEAFSYGLIGVAVFEGIMIFYGIAAAPNAISFDASTLFIGGVAIVWVFAILALLGTKLYGRLMEVIFYIPAAITIIFFAMWIAGAMNPSAVASGIQDAMGAAPSTFMTAAVNSGMTTNVTGFFDAFSFALGGAFWAYMGWYATTFLAGEVKEANKKLPMVVLTAGVVIMAVYLIASSLAAISVMNVAPYTDAAGHQWSFFQAYAWLSYPPSSASAAVEAARAAIPNFQSAWSTGIASFIARGLNLGVVSWLIAFAGVVGTDIFDALFLTLFCVSCMLLPLERKDIFDRAAVKHSAGFVVLLGFVATLGGSFCLYIFIQQSPWIWSLFTTGASSDAIMSAVGFFGCILVGILLYVGFMYRNSTKGVDMRTLYLSIPPE